MDSEQELREFQREYLDFLDDAVSFLFMWSTSTAHGPNTNPFFYEYVSLCLLLDLFSGGPRDIPGSCS